MNMLNLPNIL